MNEFITKSHTEHGEDCCDNGVDVDDSQPVEEFITNGFVATDFNWWSIVHFGEVEDDVTLADTCALEGFFDSL